jgi:pimeloyl-ACP methyl ester carboxylesterase
MSTSAVLLTLLAVGPSWENAPPPPPMPAPVAHGEVEHDGARLYYATFGRGEPVLLLHGGAGSSDHWSNQIPALSSRFRVVVLDSRGHGRSTADRRPFSYHQMAEDALAVMDGLGLKRASVVGWSDGGITAIDLAIHHPDRIHKLVPFGANFDLAGMKRGTSPALRTYFEACAEGYRRLSSTPGGYQDFLARLRLMWKRQPNFRPDELRSIRAPTLVLDGAHEEIIRSEHTKAMAGLIPNARLRLLEEASHLAPWQTPAAFTQALLDFL